jgi:hypothetical protein
LIADRDDPSTAAAVAAGRAGNNNNDSSSGGGNNNEHTPSPRRSPVCAPSGPPLGRAWTIPAGGCWLDEPDTVPSPARWSVESPPATAGRSLAATSRRTGRAQRPPRARRRIMPTNLLTPSSGPKRRWHQLCGRVLWTLERLLSNHHVMRVELVGASECV